MTTQTNVNIDREKGNFHFNTDYAFDAGTGLSEKTVRYISEVKEEDPWMLDFRMKGLSTFEKKALPTHWAKENRFRRCYGLPNNQLHWHAQPLWLTYN